MTGRALLPVLLAALTGCAAVPEAGSRPVGAGPELTDPIPAGFGSLRPDDITIDLREGPLRIEITPLDEMLLRLLVPDAADRLREVRSLAGDPGNAAPFLVTFYTEAQGVRFEQSDVTLESAGRVLRAARVVGATQGWGTGLLRQQEPASGVYLYPEVDFDQDLTAAYRTVRSDAWGRILTRIQAERGRVRGRSGGDIDGVRTEASTPDYSSSPNFRIFR